MNALKDESTFVMKADKIIAFEDFCSHILCILAIPICRVYQLNGDAFYHSNCTGTDDV